MTRRVELKRWTVNKMEAEVNGSAHPAISSTNAASTPSDTPKVDQKPAHSMHTSGASIDGRHSSPNEEHDSGGTPEHCSWPVRQARKSGAAAGPYSKSLPRSSTTSSVGCESRRSAGSSPSRSLSPSLSRRRRRTSAAES